MDWLCCVVILLTLHFGIQSEFPVVTTQLGKVRGHYKFSYDNRVFSAFEGIPYAKPPIGKLRFEEPESAVAWSGIFDATVTHACAQYGYPDLANDNEDCLYINVYVPRKNPIFNENLDVIVFIHGGAFMMGLPSFGGPKYLMDKDVVYVNLNYRLGVFGFLSTGDAVVSGNNGLKDQVLALKWVQSNIKYFGGNPNSVTLVGSSAGGASVHFHYFSKLSNGLFHKGISHSGTALAPWAVYVNPLENTLKVAETVGCTQISTKKVVECLKTKSAKSLIEATVSTYSYLSFPIAPFAPVIEKPSKTAFLTESPYTLLQKGDFMDIPWISTRTSDEGLLIVAMLQNLKDVIDKWDKNFPYILNYFHKFNPAHITSQITKYYFGDSPITDDGIIKAVGDRLFRIPMEKSVQMHARVSKSPVYSYVYAYENDLPFPSLHKITHKGANHGSDSFLIYDFSMFPSENYNLSISDEGMKSVLVDVAVTFAQNGVPKLNDINWEPVADNENWGYLRIYNKDRIVMDYVKDQKLMEFWDSLDCDYWSQITKPKIEL